MNALTTGVRRLVPVAALAMLVSAFVSAFVPVSAVAQTTSVCDQAIAEAGTGQGDFGGYERCASVWSEDGGPDAESGPSRR